MCLCCAQATKSDFLATKRGVSKSMPMNCLLFKGITAAEKRTLILLSESCYIQLYLHVVYVLLLSADFFSKISFMNKVSNIMDPNQD